MKIFFDTEFTGLHKDTTLISIGLVSQDGRTFYAELTDYNKNQVDEWIKKNVVDNLILDAYGFNSLDEKNLRIKAEKDLVRVNLQRWLEQFEEVEFVSDVSHYDMVLLIDLAYGHGLNIPYGKVNSSCHDINQDIAQYLKISEINAFDFSRELFLDLHNISIEGEKHNALYDAKVIKAIYEIIQNRSSIKTLRRNEKKA